ncbi:JAB domain-containing protein [Sphingopyxis sp.]|uniref:JAB domain-containing protein n=1 Tax=Sphingopyxis sp. TaxID=1908224 RepID=UPI002AC9AEB6|nr:JAB domain-containing protein [Sphingopyxis sp.]
MIVAESIEHVPDSAMWHGFVPRQSEDSIAQDLLRPRFPRGREAVLLLAFDRHQRLLRMEYCEEARGHELTKCRVPACCWRAIAGTNVCRVLMAHNHPSGAAWPSKADRHCTREAAELLNALGIELADHLIFVNSGHFSFRRCGLL